MAPTSALDSSTLTALWQVLLATCSLPYPVSFVSHSVAIYAMPFLKKETSIFYGSTFIQPRSQALIQLFVACSMEKQAMKSWMRTWDQG